MFYKNCSYTAKTFYGVTFEPGQTKEVDGIINNMWMVPVNDAATKVTKSTQQKPSPELPKEEISTPAPNPVEPVAEPSKEDPAPIKQEEKSGKGKKS